MKNRLKMIREESEMSMAAFGKEIGVSSASVCQFESGKRNPSRQTIMFLCDKFDVNMDWLMTGNGPKYIENATENKTAAWVTKELSNQADSFQKRFLAALSRLSPEQWDMVEDFMMQVIAKREPAPAAEAPERDED